MLNWKADEQRRQARVAEMVERTLAQPMQQATQKESFKRGERTTTGKVKHDWTNWDVDLSVVPDNVKKVDGYFRSNKVDTIHHIATDARNLCRSQDDRQQCHDNQYISSHKIL